jgi:hypothetical protein
LIFSKERRIIAVFALLYISCRVVLAIGIGECNALAPDESSYLDILIFTDNSEIVSTTSTWASLPKLVRQIAFLPALLFHKFGFTYLISLRFQTILYSALAMYLVYLTLRVILQMNTGINQEMYKESKVIKFYIVLILSMPTFFLWSTLGLREPFIYLSLGLMFLGATLITKVSKNLYFGGITLILGEIILAHTKFYLFTLFATALILAFLTDKANSLKKNLLIVIPIILVTLTAFDTAKGVFDLSFDIRKKEPVRSDRANVEYLSVSRIALQKCIVDNEAGPVILSLAKALGVSGVQPEGVQPEGVQPEGVQPEYSAATNYASDQARNVINPLRIGPGVVNFLLFPMDLKQFSSVALIGVFESIVWIPVYIFFVREIILKRRGKTRFSTIMKLSLYFISMFVAFSAATEINFGTAIRHRSVVLFPIVLVTLSLYFERKRKTNV